MAVLQSEDPVRPNGLTGSTRTSRQVNRRKRLAGLPYVMPWIIGLTVFYIGPMVATLLMSFTDYKFNSGGDKTSWVGLVNWQRAFNDPNVATGAKVTLKFAMIAVPMSLFLPLALAYLLTAKHLWARGFFRTMFFIPAIVPVVSALFVWEGYLSDQGGWFNEMLSVVGIDGPEWIRSRNHVLFALVLLGTWGVGNAILIFIGALAGVPKDLYEAARLDGAGPGRLFLHVTIPMISPILFYNVVITLVGLGQYFVVPFVLTEGSGDPDQAALFYTMNFYRESFQFNDAAYGATLGWLMFMVVMAITAFLFWSQKFWVHYEFQEKK